MNFWYQLNGVLWTTVDFRGYVAVTYTYSEDESPLFNWEPVLAGPYQFPYRLALSDEEYARVTTPV